MRWSHALQYFVMFQQSREETTISLEAYSLCVFLVCDKAVVHLFVFLCICETAEHSAHILFQLYCELGSKVVAEATAGC